MPLLLVLFAHRMAGGCTVTIVLEDSASQCYWLRCRAPQRGSSSARASGGCCSGAQASGCGVAALMRRVLRRGTLAVGASNDDVVASPPSPPCAPLFLPWSLPPHPVRPGL